MGAKSQNFYVLLPKYFMIYVRNFIKIHKILPKKSVGANWHVFKICGCHCTHANEGFAFNETLAEIKPMGVQNMFIRNPKLKGIESNR